MARRTEGGMNVADIFARYNLNDIGLDVDDPTHIIQRIRAEVTDMTDNTIIDACIKTAKEAGINNLYLMDRQFVMDALREKIQRTQQETPRWISVEDEYPDSKLKVLVIVYEDMYDMGEIKPCPAVHTAYTRGEDEGWFDWYSDEHIDPTHWLPMSVLPDLPEEE